MFDDGRLSIVNPVNSDKMLISWDVGRRCNYDCTYCPAHRHDNVSPHASLEELKASAQFVFDYLKLVMPYKHTKQASISFTGGEPTANPNFVAFGKWLRETHTANYADLYSMDLSLTTNGAMGKKMCDNLLANYQFATISYHVEAARKIKDSVIKNILYLHENNFGIKVNVMFHAEDEYFRECMTLCRLLAENGVDFVPRMIGEYKDNNRYHHHYSKAQAAWMKKYWDEQRLGKSTMEILDVCEAHMADIDAAEKAPKPEPVVDALKPEIDTEKKSANTLAPSKNISARQVGRPCCGQRPMNVCSASSGEWTKTTFITNAHFENWYCTVNWFFLHIEQQTGKVYHHQTCQANFGKKREAIADLSNTTPLLEELANNIKNKTMPVLVCPNNICGCGLCTPKAETFENLAGIIDRHVDTSIFQNNPLFKGTQ